MTVIPYCIFEMIMSFNDLAKVTDRMEELKKQYDEKSAQKEELRKKAEMLEIKLDRAGKLVSGLAGERDRWEASVKVYVQRMCLLFSLLFIYFMFDINFIVSSKYYVMYL